MNANHSTTPLLSISLSPPPPPLSLLTAGNVTEALVKLGRKRKKGTRLGLGAL